MPSTVRVGDGALGIDGCRGPMILKWWWTSLPGSMEGFVKCSSRLPHPPGILHLHFSNAFPLPTFVGAQRGPAAAFVVFASLVSSWCATGVEMHEVLGDKTI